jgi:hypothetical protein
LSWSAGSAKALRQMAQSSASASMVVSSTSLSPRIALLEAGMRARLLVGRLCWRRLAAWRDGGGDRGRVREEVGIILWDVKAKSTGSNSAGWMLYGSRWNHRHPARRVRLSSARRWLIVSPQCNASLSLQDPIHRRPAGM